MEEDDEEEDIKISEANNRPYFVPFLPFDVGLAMLLLAEMFSAKKKVCIMVVEFYWGCLWKASRRDLRGVAEKCQMPNAKWEWEWVRVTGLIGFLYYFEARPYYWLSMTANRRSPLTLKVTNASQRM